MKKRAISKSDIYHVYLRGVNKGKIFKEEDDYTFFKLSLNYAMMRSNGELFAYCLMGNHFHLLLKCDPENLPKLMQRMLITYVQWFNVKYKRTGPLFESRYKSAAIESDEYFMTVLRYIHQNPIRAGLCNELHEYKQSSYKEYLISETTNLIKPSFALELIGKNQFIPFHEIFTSETCCLGMEKRKRLNDTEAKKIIQEISNCKILSDFANLDLFIRINYINLILKKGLSKNQIKRLVNESSSVIEYAENITLE